MRLPRYATSPAAPVLWAGLVLFLLTLVPAATRADVILGNLGAGDGGNVNIDSNRYVAASFAMGSQDYSLSNVQVRLTGGAPDGLTYQLRDDASGNPSSNVLLTFTRSEASEFATKTYTFIPDSPFTLTANSTFWFVGFTTSSSARWVDSSPHTDPSGVGASFGQYKASSNSGVSWNTTSEAPIFQLNGTPVGVPEPSSLVLAGMVACVAAAVGLRRRRTRRPELAPMTARSADRT